jgi:FimV-like protein
VSNSHQVETDDNQTRLDLARAYIDMGDPDGCVTLLQEVIAEGTEAQAGEARVLLAGLGSKPIELKASHSSTEPPTKPAAYHMDDLFS